MSKQPRRSESLGSSMSRGMSQAYYGLSVAFSFVAIVIGSWWIGRQIDVRLGLEPWGQVTGAIVGWIVGVVVVVYVAQRQQ
jgi:F0F1-type ATP synthase assembly protein I